MHAMRIERETITNRQLLLMEIRDTLCGGNSAELARQIGKDATYVNRLFYPKDKAGHKGMGLEIMAAASRAFFLPAGFWDREAPGLTAEEIELSQFVRELRKTAADGRATAQELALLGDIDSPLRAKHERILERIADLQRMRDQRLDRLIETEDRLAHYTGDVEDRVAREPRAAYGMEPIRAWDHPDDLPDGEFVMVPRLDVHLSAGDGREQVEIELTKENAQAFRSEWIRLMRLKPNKLAAMRAAGDSMEPTIHDSDSLLVDTSQTSVVDGKVYALWYDGGERVKRLFRLPGGGLRIQSDNPAFGNIELGADYTGHVRIIGRVVHRSGTGGL